MSPMMGGQAGGGTGILLLLFSAIMNRHSRFSDLSTAAAQGAIDTYFHIMTFLSNNDLD
jgi:hypothetical protein